MFDEIPDGSETITTEAIEDTKVSVPLHQTPDPTPTPDNGFEIPEGYKDKPYLKGVDSAEKLYSLLDNSQKLIGSKPSGIPEETAPSEKWEEFFNQLRPKDISAYEFDIPEGAERNEEFENGVKDLFLKAALKPSQAKIIQTGFDALMEKITKEQFKSPEDIDKEFTTLATETFGNRTEQVLANGKTLLANYVPEKFKELFNENIPNQYLIPFAAVLDNIREEFISQDRLSNIGKHFSGETLASMHEEGKKLMASPEFQDPMNSRYKETVEKVNALYAKIASMS